MISALARERRRKDEGKGKNLGRDYVVKFNGILCGSEWFKKKDQKREIFMWLSSQPANLWEYESGS